MTYLICWKLLNLFSIQETSIYLVMYFSSHYFSSASKHLPIRLARNNKSLIDLHSIVSGWLSWYLQLFKQPTGVAEIVETYLMLIA